MTATIVITGELTGRKALLYQFPGRKGRRAFVPTYKAYARLDLAGGQFDFAVVRTSSAQVFEELTDRYAKDGECPPSNGTPYRGIIREDGHVGFRIELHEDGFEEEGTIKGLSAFERRRVQIHFGAAASFGCILVAGRRREYRQRFERPLRNMLLHTDTIEVIVEPRELT